MVSKIIQICNFSNHNQITLNQRDSRAEWSFSETKHYFCECHSSFSKTKWNSQICEFIDITLSPAFSAGSTESSTNIWPQVRLLGVPDFVSTARGWTICLSHRLLESCGHCREAGGASTFDANWWIQIRRDYGSWTEEII